jgi:hypothetical protein
MTCSSISIATGCSPISSAARPNCSACRHAPMKNAMASPASGARVARHPDFYGTLPLMADAMELFAAVRHLLPVTLTGLLRGSWASPQKIRWAAEHFPGTQILTVLAVDKRNHAQARRHPGRRPADACASLGGRRRHLRPSPRCGEQHRQAAGPDPRRDGRAAGRCVLDKPAHLSPSFAFRVGAPSREHRLWTSPSQTSEPRSKDDDGFPLRAGFHADTDAC